MTKKIFKSIFFSCFAVLFATIFIVFQVLYNFYGDELMNQLHMEVKSISTGVCQTGIDYLKELKLENNQRVTWINTDGTVVFDSDASTDKMAKIFSEFFISKFM